jgi:hypothetical protein
VSHGAVKRVGDFDEATDFKRDIASLVVVRDVRYRPHRWSWEVEQVGDFALDRLPSDLAPNSARWLAAVRHLL